MKKIKSITTKRYELTLYETEQGYHVYQGNNTGLSANLQVSECIADYRTADYLFELKYDELEGQ